MDSLKNGSVPLGNEGCLYVRLKFTNIWDGQKINKKLSYLYPRVKCFNYAEDVILEL